jgi:hypothetical protein
LKKKKCRPLLFLGSSKKVKELLSSGYSIDGQASAIIDKSCKGFIQKGGKKGSTLDFL